MAKVVLLTGPSAAGKTSVAHSFLQAQAGQWAYINQDDVRQLVTVGYETADGMRALWNDATKNQWNASIALCAAMAKQYKKYGINCVIDFYATKHEYDTQWEKELEGIDTQLFVLLPSLETVLTRNSQRKSPAKLSDDKIKECYLDFSDWHTHPEHLIDNSGQSVEQVVNVVSQHLTNN